MQTHETKKEDRLSAGTKVGYGTGMAAERLQTGGLNQMANPIFNDVLGIDPRLIGLSLGLTRILDAITDPIIGSLTDRTRSRFGRRKPWIVLGAFLCALSFAALWMFPRGMSSGFYLCWFAVGSLLVYSSVSLFSVPYMALGMELTPDYHERTSVMAFKALMAKMGGFLVASLYLVINLDYFTDMAEGMKYTGIGLGVMVLIFSLIPVFCCKEHPSFTERLKNKKSRQSNLIKNAKQTLRHKPFRILIATTIVMLIGLTMVLHLGYYITVYHVMGGEKGSETGVILTIAGYASQLGSLAGIPIMTYTSKRIGKRNTILCALALAFAGTLLKWICYTPENPYLAMIPSFLLAFSLVSLWTLMHSMLPDIVDLDELETDERHEGMYSAIYSWTVKLGSSLALIISGFVLDASGFDALLGSNQSDNAIFQIRLYYTFIPAIAVIGGFLLMYRYPLTEKRSYEVREELEKKRTESRRT